MEKIVEGFFKNGEVFLFEDIKMKFAKVKVIFQEEAEDLHHNQLIKKKLRVLNPFKNIPGK